MTGIIHLIGQQKRLYQSIVSVFCPILNETVYFTSEGFHHLTNKSNNKRRSINEQYLKLKCFDHAVDIVKNSSRIVETRREKHVIKGKEKSVITYELVSNNTNCKCIAVIVEKIGAGKHKFRSVKKISNHRYTNKKAP